MSDDHDREQLREHEPRFWPDECQEHGCHHDPTGFVRDEQHTRHGAIREVTRHYCALHMRSPQEYGPDGEPLGKADLHTPTPSQVRRFELNGSQRSYA